MKSIRGKRILGSFVLGALAGMIIGLFSAPYSGQEIKKRLKDRTKKLVER
jgi:gas vesicle protein